MLLASGLIDILFNDGKSGRSHQHELTQGLFSTMDTLPFKAERLGERSVVFIDADNPVAGEFCFRTEIHQRCSRILSRWQFRHETSINALDASCGHGDQVFSSLTAPYVRLCTPGR